MQVVELREGTREIGFDELEYAAPCLEPDLDEDAGAIADVVARGLDQPRRLPHGSASRRRFVRASGRIFLEGAPSSAPPADVMSGPVFEAFSKGKRIDVPALTRAVAGGMAVGVGGISSGRLARWVSWSAVAIGVRSIA